MMMLSEITEWLDKDHGITGSFLHNCYITRSQVYSEEKPDHSENVLYVADAGSCVPDSDSALHLLFVCSNITCHNCGSGLVILHSEKDTDAICSDINGEINRRGFIDHALSKLMDLVKNDNFLEPVMDYLYLLYGNPISYFDYTHTVLTYREEGPTGIYIWDHSMENRYLDPGIVNDWFLKSVHFMVDTKQTDHTLFDGNVDYYACPVMHHETLYGFICILAIHGPLQEHELTLLQKTSNLVALAYNRLSYGAGNGDFREIIKDVLDDKIKDESELQVRLVSRNWLANKRYQLVVIDLTNASEEYTQYVLDGIDGISGNIKKLVYNRYVLVLLENSYKMEDVLAYAERYELLAGVSDAFDRLFDIKIQFAKSRQALFIGRMLGHKQNIFYYNQYRFDDMLYAFHSAMRCNAYYHPMVGELETYDKRNKTEFMRTLLVYLENRNSIHKASEILHLHKNTVNYRIQRIKELFGLDYNNANDMNHIFLSLKIRELDDIFHAYQ
ncbi:MAG TPA: helix-turn-helix domain-containing protein [Anaerovoracaceae bacterium]|nr:helix-turn-helix domain-containing protein [Anaerovoracaceae bacterium]